MASEEDEEDDEVKMSRPKIEDHRPGDEWRERSEKKERGDASSIRPRPSRMANRLRTGCIVINILIDVVPFFGEQSHETYANYAAEH